MVDFERLERVTIGGTMGGQLCTDIAAILEEASSAFKVTYILCIWHLILFILYYPIFRKHICVDLCWYVKGSPNSGILLNNTRS